MSQFTRPLRTLIPRRSKNPIVVLIFSFVFFKVYAGVPNPEQHLNVNDFISRWTTHFTAAPDLFELQRGLNNCFGHDLVPPVPVIRAALHAARRLNDFPTAVRVFGALRTKTENDKQYQVYLDALAKDIEELGISTPEQLNI